MIEYTSCINRCGCDRVFLCGIVVYQIPERDIRAGGVVPDPAGVYEGAYLPCSGISDPLLCVPALYTEAGAGQEAWGMADHPGEYDRAYGIYPDPVSGASAELFQNDDVYLLLCQCIYRGSGP